MADIEHKTLDSLCRYMTDANGRGETWRVAESDGCIEVVADFPPGGGAPGGGKRTTGWIVTRGLDETSVLACLVHGANAGAGPYLDVPLLRGLDESAFDEAIRIRLAAYGY